MNKMVKLKFYDVVGKKPVITDDFEIEVRSTPKGTRYFAVAIGVNGNKMYRIISEKDYERFR